MISNTYPIPRTVRISLGSKPSSILSRKRLIATSITLVAIKRLRLKIDEGFEPKLIRTVRGMGYVLEIAE